MKSYKVHKSCSLSCEMYKFSEIFNESANSCNNYNNGSNTANNNKKPWFGHQCARSRKTYHRAKKMHAKHPSSASKA